MKNNSKQAFTLVELLVVISIIGTLSSVVFASLSSGKDKANIAAGQTFSTSANRALQDSAVAIYDFDDGAGLVAKDTSLIGGNNATVSAVGVWTTDTPSKKGYAVTFNGTTDFVETPALVMNGTSETVSVWIKTTSSSMALGHGYRRRLWATNWLLNDSSGGAASYNTLTFSKRVDDGKWHNVAYTLNNQDAIVYVDGKIAGSMTLNALMAPNGSDKWAVGGKLCTGAGCANYWSGSFDELRIYNQKLTASEIYDLYLAGAKKLGVEVPSN